VSLTSIADLQKPDYKRMLKEVTLIPRIESLLEDMNLETIKMKGEIILSGERRTHIFHSSMIGEGSGKEGKYPMGCSRKLYYSYTGAPSEGSIEPKLRRIFDTGTAIHTQLQMYLSVLAERSGGEIEFTPEDVISPETNEVADRLDISGHTDGIVTIKMPDYSVRFGLEIKTINDAGYKATKSPHGEHLTQATVYQKCFDLPVFLFLYYNKNNSTMAEFIHIFDEHRWKAIETRLNRVRMAVLDGTPPLRETSYQCNTCNWKKQCKPPSKSPFTAASKMFRKQVATDKTQD